jgi:lipoprotein-anchoring transpeptidase ErfK/SrfK
MFRYLLVLSMAFTLASVSDGQVRQQTKKPRKAPGTKATATKISPKIRYDPAIVNNAATMDVLDKDAEGSAVLRAQILLSRAHFSVGEIDGRMGTNALHAVAGFRAARGLPAGESVDADVWKALNSDTAMALAANTISPDDVAGPFVTIPASMMLKAKLKHLGYSSALEGIAEEYHIAPTLLQQLNPSTNFTVAGQKFYAPNAMPAMNEKAARVTVSKSDSTVKVLNADGKVIAQYPCTSGSEHDPLPIGEWQVNSVLKNPKFNYNPDLFWDAKPSDSKATIAAGPNNPVGVVWIDLSKEHYGIHGTPSPGLIGHTESHGCIRLTNWDAMELAGMVDKGTPVSLIE